MRTLIALLLTASVVLANGPPPRVKGKKWVKVDVEVQLGKNVTGYVFYEEGLRLDLKGPFILPFRKVELSEKKPTAIPSDVERRYTSLFAVPESAVREYKTEAGLREAIGKQLVKGVQSVDLAGVATIDENSKSDSVKWTYTITDIDEKDGIKVKITGEGYEEPKEKKPLALSEPGYLIGGIAAAVAVTLGGLWLIRRRK